MNDFTRQNRGAHATLEVLGSDVGYQIETQDRPFDGISADIRGGERNVWITFGSRKEDHITHGVAKAKLVRMLPAGERSGPVLEVEDMAGTVNLLVLTKPEEYALPPSATPANPPLG